MISGLSLVLMASLAISHRPACLTIVGTNDIHGAIESKTIISDDRRGEVRAGGLLPLSGYLDILRRQHPEGLLLLDGGDIYQGSLVSNLSQGRAMISAMNALGYDASAIGNHEFDFGPAGGPEARKMAQGEALLGILKARVEDAKFPFLANNIDSRSSQAPIAWPNVRASLLKDVAGIKVGLIGASTPTTPSATRMQYVETLKFVDPAPRIIREAARLRAQGAQLVVLIAHFGGDCAETAKPFDSSSCSRDPLYGELVHVLEAMPENTVDVAVGGHTHRFMAHWIRKTAVIESGTRASHFGMVDVCLKDPADPGTKPQGIDPETSRIWEPTPVCETTWADGSCTPRPQATTVHPAYWRKRRVMPNRRLSATVAPYLAAVSQEEKRQTGCQLSSHLPAAQIAQLTAEAMRRKTHSDFGVQNRGGVRDGLAAGAITQGQIFEVVPFDNYVAQLSITGAELTAFATDMVTHLVPALWPLWSNIRVEVGPKGVVLTDGKGQAIHATQRYTLATNDFLASGGDSHAQVLDHLPPERKHATEETMRAVLVPYLAQLFPAVKGP